MRTGDGGGQRGGTPQGLSRRRLLQGATATAGLLTLGQGHRIRTTAAQTDGLPEPEDSGIEHIVWVMMENRSFDHFLGWLEGAQSPPPSAVARRRGTVHSGRVDFRVPSSTCR